MVDLHVGAVVHALLLEVEALAGVLEGALGRIADAGAQVRRLAGDRPDDRHAVARPAHRREGEGAARLPEIVEDAGDAVDRADDGEAERVVRRLVSGQRVHSSGDRVGAGDLVG